LTDFLEPCDTGERRKERLKMMLTNRLALIVPTGGDDRVRAGVGIDAAGTQRQGFRRPDVT
jgi:hypothetical protein